MDSEWDIHQDIPRDIVSDEAASKTTTKTLQRDLTELEAMGLIVRTGKTIMANGQLLAQLLPRRRNE